MVEGDTFEVVVEPVPAGTAVVRVSGELDLATVPRLEEALARRPATEGLVIDLTGCTFVDSSCLRVLVRLARETEEAGGKAVIVATDPGILRVLEITALDTVLPVQPSVDEALALVAD